MSRQSRHNKRSLLSSLNPFSRSVDHVMEFKRRQRGYRRMQVEPLEDRRLLAIDVFINPVTNLVTIMDESGSGEVGVQEDNNVTLSLGNFDPDGGEAAVAQDGLLITDPDGARAIGIGLLQVSPTQVFVPQNFDFDPGIGTDLQNVLTAEIVIDLQDGDDTLTFSETISDVPVVTDYDIRGGSNGTFSDVLVLETEAGAIDFTRIEPDFSLPDGQLINHSGLFIGTRGFEEIVYDADGDDDALVVGLGGGTAIAEVQAAAFVNGDLVTSNVLPDIYFRDASSFTLETSGEPTQATFMLDELAGAASYTFDSIGLVNNDTLIIRGDGSSDNYTVSLDGAGQPEITDGNITIDANDLDGDDLLRIETHGGDDTLTVDVSNGLIATPIFYDGGAGSDLLITEGDADVATTDYRIGLQPDEGRLEHDDTLVEQIIDFDNLEPVVDLVPAETLTVHGTNANNAITYSLGSIGNRGLVSIDGFETIEFENKTNLEVKALDGDDTVVADNNFVTTGLESVIFNGGAGDDTIRFDNLPDASATAFVGASARGGEGDDTIDGSGINVPTPLTLVGDGGNDTLTGGFGIDDLNGGADDDTIIDSPGSAPGDIVDGGLTGNDTFVIRGTFISDSISVIQDAPTGVANDFYTLSVMGPTIGTKRLVGALGGAAPNNQANRPNIERIVVEGLAGDDIIRVGHEDAYNDLNAANGVPGQTIPFEVVGNSPNASDRLIVPDLGDGDLVIQREGPDDRSGSITVGSSAPIDYSEIEFVNVVPLDPITGGTGDDGLGRLVVFKHDPFESNNTLPNATFLGAGPTLNVDPTIDPAGVPLFGVPGDNDFYQFVAQETGTLDVQLYFEPIATLDNGRPGLPVDGELFAQVLDSDGIGVMPIPTANDLLDPVGNKIGERITVPVVRNNTYYLRVQGEVGDDVTAINVYNFTAITTPAPIPELVDLQADSDSGRNNTDDITKITNPTFDIILDDDRIDEFANLDLLPDTNDDNLATAGFDYGVEVFNNAVSIGFAFYTGVGNTWQFTAQAGDLNEGDFNHISAAVWIRDAANPAQLGRHLLSDALQITLDTVTPPVSFGLPNAASAEDGLSASSDTGVTTMPMTFADRVTSDTTPTLWGRAEANSIVRVYHDNDADGVIDLTTDTFLGQTVAVPFDGNDAYPDGFWQIDSVLDLNEIFGLPKDGVRRLLVTAEDVAGNPMPMNDEIDDGVDALNIFIDTQGPQVYDPAGPTQAVHPTIDPEYDLFDPKPSENGFTPLIDQITINVQDLPFRSGVDPNFRYEALKQDIAETLGNYMLVGDHVGPIGITNVDVVNAVVLNGQAATATITLTFADFLPDDRYTLTVSDNLVDPVGNNLDGESNANGPLDDPTFPTGDGVPGGAFVSRFTIDSRPEIGTFIPTTIAIDINGNFVWDPANAQIGNDRTNVDLTFTMDRPGLVGGGFGVHDTVFAGKFTGGGFGGGMPVPQNLFDQLGVYGYSAETGEHRWLLDIDSDGVADIYSSQPNLNAFGLDTVGALPIAGNFDNDLTNGDEIGLYYAGNWGFDFNRNFQIDAGEIVLNTGLLGAPVVGDFDGNGVDDVAVFNNNVWNFALSAGAFGAFTAFPTFQWGFSGVLERPVAADMDQDGIDDIGLFVPRNTAQPLRQTAEWYFLLSGFPDQVDLSVASIAHPFEPVPFGDDLYAEFGDELALPIVGNFDPPVSAVEVDDNNFEELPGDFDRSGMVDEADYAMWQQSFGESGINMAADGNGDGVVDLADYTMWRAHVGMTAASSGDYDGSGTVDGSDYTMWHDQFGQSGTLLAADGNGDGTVDLADFSIWRNNLEVSTASLAVASAEFSSSQPARVAAGLLSAPAAPVASAIATDAALYINDSREYTPQMRTASAVDALFADSDDLLLISDRIAESDDSDPVAFEVSEEAEQVTAEEEEAFAVL